MSNQLRSLNSISREDETQLNGDPLLYNTRVQQRYETALMKLVNEMISTTNREFTKLIKSEGTMDDKEDSNESVSTKVKRLLAKLNERFQKLFDMESRTLANTMLENSKKASQASLHASLKKLTGGLSLNTGVVSKGLETVSQAIVSENVTLIQSIPQQYLKDVASAVYTSITSGKGLQGLIPQIQQYGDITERRATGIALDQTRKAYSGINRERMKSLGVKKFRWIHSGGGAHPRPTHVAMHRKVYALDDLPVINKDRPKEPEIRGFPGDLPNCKCTMAVVFDFEED